ncbi:MAG: sensor histidine kinase CheA, partial [Gemmatimonadetes bacterium]|nr:sensor histidine kinase CheA [Gemmatimonadota bacterium]
MDTLQYAELFLTESREHVAAVNQALLSLEREATGPAAAAAVDEIFRAVHTVKGMSAMMGYAIVAELAHELETVLDRARRDDLVIDGEMMDLFFRSADVLEQAIEAAVVGREGEVSAADLVATLRALGGTPSEGGAWTVPAPATAGTLVRVRLSPDTPLRGVRAFIIVQTMAKLGEVTSTEPSLDALQSEGFDADFALRIVTPLDAADIERVVRGSGDVADVQVGDDVAAPRRGAPGAPAA